MLCVRSLLPLFPGSNELDQLSKIHDVLGTPSQKCLAKLQKVAGRGWRSNGEVVAKLFGYKKGTGIGILVPHASKDCLGLLTGMLMYDADDRYSAHKCLRHPYFKNLRDAEKASRKGVLTMSDRRVAKQPAIQLPATPFPAYSRATMPSPGSTPYRTVKPVHGRKKSSSTREAMNYNTKNQQAASFKQQQANAQKQQDASKKFAHKAHLGEETGKGSGTKRAPARARL